MSKKEDVKVEVAEFIQIYAEQHEFNTRQEIDTLIKLVGNGRVDEFPGLLHLVGGVDIDE